MNTNGVLSVPDDNPNDSTTPGRLTLLDDRVGGHPRRSIPSSNGFTVLHPV
jgi:hypothetical protein